MTDDQWRTGSSVSSEWRKDEQETVMSVVYVRQPWQWNEGTFASGLTLAVAYTNRKI